ncbi:MAG: DUF202 domain-containing protein [Rickettsiaceae bacterium]|jgi:uncharacterized membrane protein YidH (DUF202 family)|nr:DUF202 domain-containing protein [Rickettsiaceae bacterium]
MRKIPSLKNDSSSALERTYLTWLRMSLSMLAVSILSLKIISINHNTLNVAIAIIAFVGSLALSLINFFYFHKTNTIYLLLFAFIVTNLIAIITILESIQ